MAPPRPPPELPWLLAVVAVAVALIGWPVLGALDGHALGAPDGENLTGSWVLAWAQDCLLEGRPPLDVPGLGHPEGAILHALALVDALVTLPLRPVLSPVGRYNVAALFEVSLAALGAWLWLRDTVGGPAPARAPAALAFAASPYLLGVAAGGPIESFAVGWVPLTCWAAQRVFGAPRARPGPVVGAGLLLGASFLASPYAFVFAVLFTAAVVLTDPAAPPLPTLIRRALPIGLVGAAVVAPQAWLIQASMDDPRAVFSGSNDGALRSRLIRDRFVFDLAGFVVPTDRWLRESLSPNRTYLGLSLLGMAALGVGRRGWVRWAVLAAVVVVFAAGGSLQFAGWAPTWGGEPVPLPAGFLTERLRPFTWISHPFRATPLATLALAALAARGLARLPARALPAVGALGMALVAVDTAVVTPLPWPLPTTPWRPAAFWSELASLPPTDAPAVVELAQVPDPYMNGRAMLNQRIHGRPIPYRMGEPSRSTASAPFTILAMTPAVAAPATQGCDALEASRDQGVGWFVVVRPHPSDRRVDLLDRCLERTVDDGEVVAWQLPAP